MKQVNSKFPYLTPKSSNYSKVYMYHSYAKSSYLRGCEVWGIFFEAENKADIWIVNPFGATERVSMSEIYSNSRTEEDPDFSFELHRVKNKDIAKKEISQFFIDFKASRPGSSSQFIIMSQCNIRKIYIYIYF